MLTTTGQEVWAGRVNSELNGNDFSGYNAIQLWVKTDGQAQKVVVQVADDSGEEFEVYLTDLATEVQEKWITIPFDSFKGKQNGTLNTSDITKFAVWCNSIIPEGHEGDWTVDSTIYYDAIEAVNISEEDLAKVDANGLIVTDEPLATVESSQEEMVEVTEEVTEEATAEATDNDATDTNTDETTKAGKGSTVITIIVAIVLVVIISRSSLFIKKKK
jgi:mannan endo-1,4-beta-mannosidase